MRSQGSLFLWPLFYSLLQARGRGSPACSLPIRKGCRVTRMDTQDRRSYYLHLIGSLVGEREKEDSRLHKPGAFKPASLH
ncbi:hypothetical protein GGR56DRAFT_261103 [Xylariaceae sp. FL0804]|nr:hypothetical protein GGR56DRAFT_261103 [Xylariaceae sp. FL0804]